MRLAAIAIAAYLATGPALAQRAPLCPTSEYAQLKDRAATPEGRRQLAAQFCAWKMVHDVEAKHAPAGRDRAACAAEMSKAMDALQASGDAEQIARARAGCPDLIPK
jgi:hypothetical protein